MLRELQREIGTSLFADFRSPAPAAIAGAPARAAARFMIHRGNVVESLVNALGHTYPAIKAIAGDRNFRALAAAYVRARPPRRPELLAYGRDFAEFVEGHDAATSDYPFLADLARLEWAAHDAYFAADAAALAPETLGAVAPDRLPLLRFTLHPAARLVVSRDHPIHALWSAISARGTLPHPIPAGGEAALVVRPVAEVDVFALDPGETVFLRDLAAGAALEKAAEAALSASAGFDLQAALAALLSRGVFGAEVSFNPTPNGGVT